MRQRDLGDGRNTGNCRTRGYNANRGWSISHCLGWSTVVSRRKVCYWWNGSGSVLRRVRLVGNCSRHVGLRLRPFERCCEGLETNRVVRI